nr:MAG TPA: hypothetical protein [Caudoviricetes sp.]
MRLFNFYTYSVTRNVTRDKLPNLYVTPVTLHCHITPFHPVMTYKFTVILHPLHPS